MADLDRLAALPAEALHASGVATSAREIFDRFLALLESGQARAAAPGPDGRWQVDARVKRGVLFGFKLGRLVEMGDAALPFVDKDTYPVRAFPVSARVRVVPGGSSVRRGAYVAPGVTIMPPAFVNVGAYVDEGAMIDSHALVGSCAQLGKRVHLSAAAQVGGVLEPVGALPVIIEDDCFIGGNTGVYEGTIVRARAVLAAGVVVTRSSRVFDLVNERELAASGDGPLEIPAGAVVVAGSRPASGEYARAHGLQLAAPVIVKYRDEKTDARATLEAALR
ncbi:MAG: 2,3,4,5-tetrahydropyridine-2,6-dicarboxylate N-succinyltransferase [Deltaproteobacteria bacterium]|nr:2,3,4,5-tetrahydropyridine-2,6-dicarboxylate N-succinyltransferase [Deltaproteobacteria bacterium]